MISLLKLLPRSLTTFLYAVAALLRFYGNTTEIPFTQLPLTLLQWSFLAFALGTASILVNIGLEWHAGNRAEDERVRAENERIRAENERLEERERSSRQTRIQTRWIILQAQHELENSSETRSALRDFISFLQEYNE